MYRLVAYFLGCFFCVSLMGTTVLANGRHVPSGSVVQKRPVQSKIISAHRRAKRHDAVVTIYPGSLKANIVRLSRHFGWHRLIWQASNDYNWVGRTRMVAADYPGILSKLLNDYPLQAIFYRGNHVLVIRSRNIS